MNDLRAHAEEYLAMRRTLGFKLASQGRHLMSFVCFCEERHLQHVRADAAIEWATQTATGSTDPVYQARRLDVVRIFARHLQAIDPVTEVPPDDVLTRRYRRAQPYLYTEREVTALMSAADRLTPTIRAATWRTFIGLLAVTGMRSGEACRLQCGHVDLHTSALVIVDSKFGKSRQVFLHPSTISALRNYEQARDHSFPERQAATFFVNSRGGRLDPSNIQHTFRELTMTAGIPGPPGGRAVRLHDLRHVFSVVTLLAWYRDGQDVQARLPLLSTWLGHVDPKSTYWYLQAVPELLALAAARLENSTSPERAWS